MTTPDGKKWWKGVGKTTSAEMPPSASCAASRLALSQFTSRTPGCEPALPVPSANSEEDGFDLHPRIVEICCPGVELLVPPPLKVRLVVQDIGAGMHVRGDDQVPLVLSARLRFISCQSDPPLNCRFACLDRSNSISQCHYPISRINHLMRRQRPLSQVSPHHRSLSSTPRAMEAELDLGRCLPRSSTVWRPGTTAPSGGPPCSRPHRGAGQRARRHAPPARSRGTWPWTGVRDVLLGELSLVGQDGRPVGQQAGRLNVHRALGDLPLDTLEVRNGLPEGRSLLHVFGGVSIEGALLPARLPRAGHNWAQWHSDPTWPVGNPPPHR